MGSQLEVARAIHAALYPRAPYTPWTKPLPGCPRHLKAFTYGLNRTYHAAILDAVEQPGRRRGANCDFARTPCVETTRSNSGGGWDYSGLRQYAAEVPLLQRLLRLEQTDQPHLADIFVVPWLASTDVNANERPNTQWAPYNGRSAARLHGLVRRGLAHFHGKLRRRHVFLSSRDLAFSITALRNLTDHTGALLLHYG